MIRKTGREYSFQKQEQNGRVYGAKANPKKDGGSENYDIFAL
jgi:hypothetical protein